MSLETLIEAARYVEQQEQRAKQFQHLNLQNQSTLINKNNNHQHQIQRSTTTTASFKIVSPIPTITAHHPQSPPAALIAVPQVHTIVQQSSQGHSLVSPPPIQNGSIIQTPRPPGQVHQVQNTPVMVSTQQTGVVEVIQKPLPPTITVQPQQIQTITNGFDKATALLLDENQLNHNNNQQQQGGLVTSQSQDLKKRNHNPCVMRSGTREVHNKLEKNRRAHLKECFELLKKQLPPQQDEKKSSNLSILHSALRYIQGLKKKERENEHEMERLAREKIASQQRLAALKKELGPQWDNIDFSTLLQPPEPPLLALTTTTATTTNGNSFQNVVTAVSTPMVGTISTSPDIIPPPPNPIKEELYDSDEPHHRVLNSLTNGITNTNNMIGVSNASNTVVATTTATTTLQPAQLSVPVLPLSQVGYPVSQGLVLGVQKVALVSSKSLPLVSSPIAHILPQLNGKVVPLVNAQYLMKPVVVVSTPNTANTTISPRPS